MPSTAIADSLVHPVAHPLVLALVLGAAVEEPAVSITIDPERVMVGSSHFQVVNDGVVDGRIDVSAQFVDDAYVIHDVSVSAGLGIEEDILIRLDGETFAPRAVDLHGDLAGTHVQASVRFADSRATGSIHMHRPTDGRSQDRPIDIQLPSNTLTRGTALYLANAMGPLHEDEPLAFHWFNPISGQVASITYSLESAERITVPAGSFDCDVIRQEGGQPGNLIYIDQETGQIVRFDVVGQPIRLELMPGEG